jgi:DNA-binding NtrC family response regulator
MVPERKRVLIVDDEVDITWSISKGLAKDYNNFEVICVNSGNDALDMLCRYQIKVIVTDLRMPGVDGFQLLNEIKIKYPDTKVIIMTAFGSETSELIKESTVKGYIEKPFEINDLRKMIYTCLKENGRTEHVNY